MPSVTMNQTLGDVLKHEYDRAYCREIGTILTGRSLKVGAVLAARTVDPTAANTTAAAVGGNTGNGTITKDATEPVLAGAVAGIYRAVCVEAAANGGTFLVHRPDGSIVGIAKVGVAFASEVKFTIADGATDFVAGDAFTITVPAGDGKYVACVNAAQADGTHIPAALLLSDTDATSADKKAALLLRGPAMVSAGALVWHSTIDDAAKKAAKLAILAKLGIVARTTA